MAKIVKNDSEGIEECVKFLKNGKIIVYPTETAYGLGCDLTNKKAVERVYKIKKRNKEKNLTAVVSDIQMAERYGKISKKDEKLIKKFMPGPLTLIIPKKNKFPDLANKEFAFRISSNEFVKKLLKEFKKPIVSTSANISGKENIYKGSKIIKLFENKVDLIVDAGDLVKRKVSTIVKSKPKLKIIRKGPISKKEIKEALK